MAGHDEHRHDFAFLAGVIVGAISGALATLALTPMSGAETREKLRSRAAQADLAPVRERATAVAGSAQHLVAASREKATGLAAKAPELAAKMPLPVGQRHGEDAMASEHPSSGTLAGRDRTPHTSEPAEGRRDAGTTDARASGDGDGRTPHTSEPAEGRADAPPATEKPAVTFKPISPSSGS